MCCLPYRDYVHIHVHVQCTCAYIYYYGPRSLKSSIVATMKEFRFNILYKSSAIVGQGLRLNVMRELELESTGEDEREGGEVLLE